MFRARTPAIVVATLVGVLLLVTAAASPASPQANHTTYNDVLAGTPVVFKLTHSYLIIPSQIRIKLAEKLALANWHGRTRCDGPIKFQFASYGATLSNVVAEARWSWAGGKSPFLNCRIVFNLDHRTISFRYFCAALTHEYGHLSGWHDPDGLDGGLHSRDPSSIMYPILSAKNVPRNCLISSRTGPVTGTSP